MPCLLWHHVRHRIHPRQDISLDHIAEAAHISPFHFSRVFKKETHLSPHQFLLNLRIKNATGLLLHTSLSIREIGGRSGFNNPEHFITAFKKRTGLSPNQFRKSPGADYGTSSAKINFTGGVLDCSNVSSGWGVKLNGSYWNVTNMTIRNAPDAGLVLQYGGYNYIGNVTTTGNHDTGLQIYNGSHHNYVLNCYSANNYDNQDGGENADGFACKLSGGSNNHFENCTAYHNSDDGWDMYGQPYTVTIESCTATYHGYGTDGDGNGFKFGSSGQNVPHTATYCTSSYNAAWGYDGNGNTGHITLTGSGGTGNGSGLFTRIY